MNFFPRGVRVYVANFTLGESILENRTHIHVCLIGRNAREGGREGGREEV